ncbi:MAG: hypothetical protein ACRDHZ_09165, partial [Ktedonobacteraceae bacterium]
LKCAKFPIHSRRRYELRFASLFQLFGSTGLVVLDHALRDLIEEFPLKLLQEKFEVVVMEIDRF